MVAPPDGGDSQQYSCFSVKDMGSEMLISVQTHLTTLSLTLNHRIFSRPVSSSLLAYSTHQRVLWHLLLLLSASTFLVHSTVIITLDGHQKACEMVFGLGVLFVCSLNSPPFHSRLLISQPFWCASRVWWFFNRTIGALRPSESFCKSSPLSWSMSPSSSAHLVFFSVGLLDSCK